MLNKIKIVNSLKVISQFVNKVKGIEEPPLQHKENLQIQLCEVQDTDVRNSKHGGECQVLMKNLEYGNTASEHVAQTRVNE